ncbi:hypothetical protein [Catellatospora bangladeshensis]|nr:hypothetical protein [Catellatospora bangladeshensis]
MRPDTNDPRTVERTFTEIMRINDVLQASPLSVLAARFRGLSRQLAAGEITREQLEARMAESRRTLGFPVDGEREAC